MVGRILMALVFVIIIMMIVFWWISGGPGKVVTGAKDQPNIVASFFHGSLTQNILGIKLPWQGAVAMPGGADISKYTGTGTDGAHGTAYTQDQLDQARNFGMSSPYRSQVTLQQGQATASNPAKEYIAIKSASDNEGTVDLTGWSVQSAVSGERYYLPSATVIFIGGAVNSTNQVSLPPSATAIIATGVSPVGVSFRENICSGYLGKLQSFHPDFGFASCPNPSDAMPETAENLRAYGSKCLDYVRSLSSCEFPQDLPASLSPACRSYVTNVFSYNGCVHMHQGLPSFMQNSWRLYLNAQTSIWDDTHDIIRLLDAQGRTVDAVTY